MLREKWLAMRSKLAFFLMRHSITVRLEHTADGGVQQNTESSAAISKYCHQISAHNILCPEARPTESQVHVSCCTPQLLDQKTFPRIFRKNKNKLNWSGCHSALTHRHLIYTISHTAGNSVESIQCFLDTKVKGTETKYVHDTAAKNSPSTLPTISIGINKKQLN